MFGKAELNRLQAQKQLLILECQASRLTVAAEWQRLHTTDFWQKETTQAVRQHPWLTAGLAVGAGVLAVRILRHPTALLGLLGKVGGVGSVLMSVWKMFGSK